MAEFVLLLIANILLGLCALGISQGSPDHRLPWTGGFNLLAAGLYLWELTFLINAWPGS